MKSVVVLVDLGGGEVARKDSGLATNRPFNRLGDGQQLVVLRLRDSLMRSIWESRRSYTGGWSE